MVGEGALVLASRALFAARFGHWQSIAAPLSAKKIAARGERGHRVRSIRGDIYEGSLGAPLAARLLWLTLAEKTKNRVRFAVMALRFARGCSLGLFLLAACSAPLPGLDAGSDAGISDERGSIVPMDVMSSDGGVGQDAAPDVEIPAGPYTARFQIPATGVAPNQYAMPWPSDLAVDTNGKVDLRFIAGALSGGLARTYVDQMAGKLQGFSPVGGAYFRFTGPLDLASLPATPGASLVANASVQLINVQQDSPDFGQRIPVVHQFSAVGSRFWPSYTLAIAPAPGFPLRPRTQYAVIVTNRVRGVDGEPLRRDADFTEIMGDSPSARLMPVAALIKPALTRVAGLDLSTVVSATVYTTSDPTSEFFRAAEVTLNAARAPELRSLSFIVRGDAFSTYRGDYGPNPVFQAGEPPYLAEGSGDFVSGPDGMPIVQRYETSIQFALTVPNGPMPPAGWPIAIYAHGTGGNASSFINDGTAQSLAAQGIACLGFDQLFNGARTIRGGTAESQFFNFANPLAARSNNRQAGIDLVQAGRFVRSLRVSSMVTMGDEIRFDGEHVMFFGHSQGGLNGPLWLATPRGPEAAVLSGAGGWLTLSLVLKTEPVNIPGVVAGLLNVPRAELTPLHPAVTLAQTIADPSDTVHYARYIVNEPRMGGVPKHVFMTQGFIDRYTPPAAIAALAVSIGLPLVEPVIHPDTIGPLTDWPRARAPFARNLAMGGATGGWSQYNAVGRSDGHFVVFDDPAATLRAARFLATFASDRAIGPRVE